MTQRIVPNDTRPPADKDEQARCDVPSHQERRIGTVVPRLAEIANAVDLFRHKHRKHSRVVMVNDGHKLLSFASTAETDSTDTDGTDTIRSQASSRGAAATGRAHLRTA
jgi:hypothetical protein